MKTGFLQFAPILLALGLWIACPGWARGQGVINQSTTSGDDLDSLFNLPTNSVAVIAGITIENSANGGYAISGSSRTWSVTNAATLNGNGIGVYLGDGGILNNQSAGNIAGGNTGVEIYNNGILTLDNAGWISGNGEGIAVNESGIVTNESGGTIAGGTDGIFGFGGPQIIFNAGTIIGTNNTAILYAHGGNVINSPKGTIEGYTGIFLNGGFCYVTNGGSVFGEDTGVNLFSGGSLNNLTNGIIAGGNYGESGGSVNNAGIILSTNNIGILLGGILNNQHGGIILGGEVGVEIDGGSGSMTNAGTIIGEGGTAIGLGGFESIVTLQTGSDVRGDIAGAGDGNMACLQGNGSYSNDFLYFGSLTVQADAIGWDLTGTNTFQTGSEMQSGLLRIDGILTTPMLTVDQSGTLGGNGFINGSVTVEPAGTIAPGTMADTATLTVSGDVMLQGVAMMKLDPDNGNNDALNANDVTYGGTLAVTNLSATSPTNGQSFQLFSTTSYSGTFGGFNLPHLAAGLAWIWNPTNGTLAVVSASPLQILSPQFSVTNFSFSFATEAGKSYTIWVNTNLATTSWMIVTNLTGNAPSYQVILPDQPGNPASFFRVSQP